MKYKNLIGKMLVIPILKKNKILMILNADPKNMNIKINHILSNDYEVS